MTEPIAARPAELEADLLLETIVRLTGTLLAGHDRHLLLRRLVDHLQFSRVSRPAQLIPRILEEPAQLDLLVDAILVKTTALFRDVAFFRLLRQRVVPYLQTYPQVRVWDVGCSTGLETYSLAIVLDEEGLGDRTIIYATDINRHALQQAEAGIHSASDLPAAEERYLAAGGKRSLGAYLKVEEPDRLTVLPRVKRKIVFAGHDIARDTAIGAMHIAICRNVLIYLADGQRQLAIARLDDCLEPHGFLVLGDDEQLHPAEVAGRYEELAPGARVYQKRPPREYVRRQTVVARQLLDETVSMPPIDLSPPSNRLPGAPR